jgi:hypothetical protein
MSAWMVSRQNRRQKASDGRATGTHGHAMTHAETGAPCGAIEHDCGQSERHHACGKSWEQRVSSVTTSPDVHARGNRQHKRDDVEFHASPGCHQANGGNRKQRTGNASRPFDASALVGAQHSAFDLI